MRSIHTPQQETSGAYNPGVAYQGGQFLAQGIGQAGNAIAEGLQRYAQQKQEDQYLGTRLETLAPQLQKYATYEELGDESGPARTLHDKLADWANQPLAKKKALLVDAEMFIGKKEKDQQRAEEQNKWQALQQFHQDQFAEIQKQHGIANDLRQREFNQQLTAYGDASPARDAIIQYHLAQTKGLTRGFAGEDLADSDAGNAWQHIAKYSTAPGGTGPVLPLSQTVQEALSLYPNATQSKGFVRALGLLERFSDRGQSSADNKPAEYTDSKQQVWIYNPRTGNYQRRDATGYEPAMDSEGNPVAGLGTLGGKVVKMPTPKEALVPKGKGPTISEDKKFYWDEHFGAWKPVHESPYEALGRLTGGTNPTAADRKAEGGYIVGRVYGGKKYLGGSPTTPGNWETVR